MEVNFNFSNVRIKSNFVHEGKVNNKTSIPSFSRSTPAPTESKCKNSPILDQVSITSTQSRPADYVISIDDATDLSEGHSQDSQSQQDVSQTPQTDVDLDMNLPFSSEIPNATEKDPEEVGNEPHEQSMQNIDIITAKENLFLKVRTWMRKNARGLYEQVKGHSLISFPGF